MLDYDEPHGGKVPVKVNLRYVLPEHIVVLSIELQKSDNISSAAVPRKTPMLGWKKEIPLWIASRMQHQRRDVCRKPLPTEVVPPVLTIMAPRHTFVLCS